MADDGLSQLTDHEKTGLLALHQRRSLSAIAANRDAARYSREACWANGQAAWPAKLPCHIVKPRSRSLANNVKQQLFSF